MRVDHGRLHRSTTHWGQNLAERRVRSNHFPLIPVLFFLVFFGFLVVLIQLVQLCFLTCLLLCV